MCQISGWIRRTSFPFHASWQVAGRIQYISDHPTTKLAHDLRHGPHGLWQSNTVVGPNEYAAFKRGDKIINDCRAGMVNHSLCAERLDIFEIALRRRRHDPEARGDRQLDS